MPFCTTCGKTVADDWTYCPVCGTRRHASRSGTLEEYRRRLLAELDNPRIPMSRMPGELDQVTGEIERAVGRLWQGPAREKAATRPHASRTVTVPGTDVRIGLPLAVALGLLLLVTVSIATEGVGLVVLLALLGAATLFAVSAGGSAPVTQPGDLHRTIEEKLDACHSLIAEIEGTIGLDLLPSDSPLLRDYVAALEARAEGWGRFEEATTRAELVEADRWVQRALDGLQRTRDALAASRHEQV